MIEFSDIVKIEVKSYIDTLRQIEVGETRYFRLVGTAYSGFHNAKTRLSRKKIEFTFKQIIENDEECLEIIRTK